MTCTGEGSSLVRDTRDGEWGRLWVCKDTRAYGDMRLVGRPDVVMSTRQLSVPTGGWQCGHGVVVSTRMSCKWLLCGQSVVPST